MMKKLLVMACAIVPICVLASVAVAADPVPVFEYRFSPSYDGTSTTCFDLSTGGNDMIMESTGAYDADVRPPGFTHYGSLNGANGGYGMTTGTGQLYNSFVEQHGGYYFDVWVKPAEYAEANARIIDNSTDALMVKPNGDGTHSFAYYSNSTQVLTSDPITFGEWYHVVASFDTEGNTINPAGTISGSATLIVNGQIQQNAAIKGPDYARPLSIGRWNIPAGGFLNPGHFYNPSVFLGSSPDVPEYVDPGASGNVVGHWTFDETVGATTAVDSSGNGRDATIMGTVAPGQAGTAAYSGTSYGFDGGECRVLAAYDSGIGSESFTVATWVKIDEALEAGELLGIVDNRATSTDTGSLVWKGYDFFCTETSVSCIMGDADDSTTQLTVSSPLVADEWTHLAISYDADTNMAAIFVNGELGDMRITDFVPNDVHGFSIGQVSGDGSTDIEPGFNYYPFVGDMDDVWLFDYALNSGQIVTLMDDGTPPTAPTAIPEPGCAALLLGLFAGVLLLGRNAKGRKLLCLSLLAASIAFSATHAKAAVKIFLIGGQSNAAGVGAHSTDDPIPPPYDVPQTDVKIWNASTGGWSDLQLGFGNVSTQFGPEITFGDNIKDLYPDDEIYLVKHAISSTDLHVEWKPNAPKGHMYNTLTARTNAAIANLSAAGKSPEVAGMIWMQGESDAYDPAFAPHYRDNLINFVQTVRSDYSAYSASNMRFVAGRILAIPEYGTPEDNAMVRAAIESAGDVNQPTYVDNYSWINTDDLQRAYWGHYGTQGQLDLGARFAAEFDADDPIPVVPPTPMSSTAFGYKYEMNADPTNASAVDLDGNSESDWGYWESPAATYAEGKMSMSEHTVLISGAAGTDLWPAEAFTAADGFTVEFQAKAVDGTDGRSVASFNICLSDSDEYGSFKLAPDGQEWFNGNDEVQNNDNTSAYHTFRVARSPDADGGKWWFWRDGVLLTPDGADQSGFLSNRDRVYFGPGVSTSYDGTLEVDFVRLIEDGAYAPIERTPGDANEDGNVDVTDLGILATNYGAGGLGWFDGDFTGDGLVDVSDLGILATNYGTVPVAQAVPEPGITALLLGAICSALIVFRRRGPS